MQNFTDLDVYNRSKKLFPVLYKIVRSWDLEDQRGLGNQIIRAGNSIHANIAEGFSKTPNDFKRYLGISLGSCDEIRSHISDAHNVGLIDEKTKNSLLLEFEIIGKQINKLKQNWK